jgi:hypothetical protein
MRTRSDGLCGRNFNQVCSSFRKTPRQTDFPSSVTASANGDRGISHDKQEEMQDMAGSDAAAISFGCVFVAGSARRSSPK